ncbi:hypothetical protein AB0F96_00275 [Streptomyces sp. NPDC023998]|uniref:hypothetical protein n=1 Tax=Streptomyces sp. NPDC023998 TaxID=3154597 RepID=UPI0033D7849F
MELEPWILEVQAVAVTAHAWHGRLDLVEEINGVVEDRLGALLTRRDALPALVNFPVCGALLLALGAVDLDPGRTRSGARFLALAERFHRPCRRTTCAARWPQWPVGSG